MDLRPVFAGAIPLDLDFLQPQRNAEIALGFVLQAAFGTNTIADGLTCTPTSPASLSVNVGPGSMIFASTVDTVASGFGALPLDSSTPLVKMGINTAPTLMAPLTAPVTAGQSQNYLIQASFSETDGSPVVLPYYNAANPAVPYSGPTNSGAAQNTKRAQTVNLGVKAGTPATTGSQATPTVDTGFVGLWVVTLANGQSSITSGNIATFAQAPFIPAKLGPGSLFGFGRAQAFSSSGTFVVPNGVTRIRVHLRGGGGGGGGCINTGSAAIGGSGGGYSEGIYTVTPGQSITATIGAAGAAGAALGGNGGPGGTTSFGGLLSATGGGGGAGASNGIQTTGTGAVGTGSGGNIWNLSGMAGQVGFITGNVSLLLGGAGGASPFFSMISGSVAGGGANGLYPGCGGGGASAAAAGGAGAAGYIVVEW